MEIILPRIVANQWFEMILFFVYIYLARAVILFQDGEKSEVKICCNWNLFEYSDKF
jgi:hypothetical protein